MVICGLPVGEPDYAKHWAAKLTDRVIEEQRAIIAAANLIAASQRNPPAEPGN